MHTEAVGQSQIIPASFMMQAVLCYSVVPVLIELGELSVNGAGFAVPFAGAV